MNDLDLVREMRADAPEPSAGQLAAGRDRLRSAFGSPAASARSRPALIRRPAIIAGGLALAAAATAVVVTVGGSGRQEGHVGPRPSSIQLAAATEVLDKAARTVESRPAPKLEPHQWLYYRFTAYHHAAGGETDQSWIRMDGMQDASMVGGKLVVTRHSTAESAEGTPLGAYRLLASLPTDPHALLATLYAKVGSEPRGGGQSKQELAFENIQQLLWNSPAGAPPRVQGALYRALAQLPGIQVKRDFQYAPRRTAIAVFHLPTSAILLDPTSYQMIGWASVSDGHRPPAPKPSNAAEARQMAHDPKKYPWNSPALPAGTVINSFYRDHVAVVSAPGRR
ncbi:hypothetical protein GCM10023195_78450 [Actinoallomurus liliacearum]|uniref:CU044_5270 family protein n=1 Tax=Actinoallomurus liliacearum TaxID=1080073 RepID=A0ABP8TZL6_9ACTN